MPQSTTVTENRIVDEVCFDTFDEYLEFMSGNDGEAGRNNDSEGPAANTFQSASNSLIVFWEDFNFSGYWWNYLFLETCADGDQSLTNMGPQRNLANSVASNHQYSCHMSILFEGIDFTGNDYWCHDACGSLTWMNNNSESFVVLDW